LILTSFCWILGYPILTDQELSHRSVNSTNAQS